VGYDKLLLQEKKLYSVPSVYMARDKGAQNTPLCRPQSSLRNRWKVQKNYICETEIHSTLP